MSDFQKMHHLLLQHKIRKLNIEISFFKFNLSIEYHGGFLWPPYEHTDFENGSYIFYNKWKPIQNYNKVNKLARTILQNLSSIL